jgi:hypothetical protein
MKHFLFTFLIFFLIAIPYSFAQTGKISGHVKDQKTGEALIGVNVIVQGTRLGAASNYEGFYSIINVSPGSCTVSASFVGYVGTQIVDVKVAINQTTELNLELVDQSIQTNEVVVVAVRPVVQKDVSNSTFNLGKEDFQNLPVASVNSTIQLQAGIKAGLEIRGGGSDQTVFMLNGLSMRDERTNAPFTAISLTSIEQIQVQTGGFNAEYGNIRSGLVNAVTKEGDLHAYSFSFIGRYRAAGKKSFEANPGSPQFFYIRPYVDPAVCWTGTTNGAWNAYEQQQYPAFVGWNNYVLTAPAPYQGLTPEAAQRLFLWQHRKSFAIDKPDHDVDMSFTGPVPLAEELGNLRFLVSYRELLSQLLMPMNTRYYYENSMQAKMTADLGLGMKLTFDVLRANQAGTAQYRDGSAGIYTTAGEIAANSYQRGSDGESRIYSTDYWCPASTQRTMVGGKFTHALSQNSLYEVRANYYGTQYTKYPGLRRNSANIYEIIPGAYYTNQAPFGYEPINATTGIGSSMRMGGGGMSYGRDTSFLSSLNIRADYTNQYNKYNFLKAGAEITFSKNEVNQGIADSALPSNNTKYRWDTKPFRGAVYVQDKIEFEGMIANIGLRLDFLNPNTEWYVIPDSYDPSLSANPSQPIEALKTGSVKTQVKLSPRLGVAFPITISSKLYFNYGHFLQVPTPDNLFLLRRDLYSGGRIAQLSDPSLPMQRTVAYELGYEQSFFDEFLVKVAGYYKDVSNETRLVTYVSKDNSVNYTTPRPDLYEDIRGFEFTFSRNKGEWATGFFNYTYSVSTYGYYNYTTYYENPSKQREFIRTFLDNDQRKPIPQPYARLNLDLFTPYEDFGPDISGIGLLTDWRLNILASWSAGEYFTWTGGGTVPGYQYNFQWSDFWNVDLRVSKNIKLGSVNLQFFADIYNALNYKRMSRTAGYTENDFDNYMKSLHLGKTDHDARFGYVNIPGDDKPGMYREYSTPFTPMVGVATLASVSKPVSGAIYYEQATERYAEYLNNAWTDVDPARIKKIKDDKSYIDMPNLGFFSFLNPRNIYMGVKLSVELF